MLRSSSTPPEPWRKTLYIIWAAQFIAMLGMSLVVPFLPFYIRHLGVTDEASVAQWSGLVFSGPFLPAFFLTPVWGYLGDRYGRKFMTVRAIFGLGLSQVLIGFAWSVESLFVFRMVQGAISGFLASAMALVSVNTPRHRSGYAIGLLQTATSAGNVLGPFLGGSLADTIGYRPVFFLVAGLCTITGFIILFFVHDRTKPEASSAHPIGLRSNYRYVFAHRPIAVALGLIVISQMSVFFVQPIFALYVDSMLGGTEYVATAAGAIFSVAGLFTVISAPWWGRRNDRKSIRKNLSLAFLGAGIAYGLHAVLTHIAPLVVVRALLGFSLGGMLPVLYSYVSKFAPPNRRGGILGIATSGNTLANFIGAPLGGFIGAHLGLRSVFLFALGMLLLSIWAVRSNLVEAPKDDGNEPTTTPLPVADRSPSESSSV
jgi:DHA1 family multidrug resistance protein-like MFS transporter